MKKIPFTLILISTLLLTNFSASADEMSDLEDYINDALASLNNFSNDPEMKWFRDHIKDAKGLLIIPRLYKAGFLLGGSGGTGILLRRSNADSPEAYSVTNMWSDPAFYTMISITAGAQAGGEAAEVMLVIMTDNGMDTLLSTKLQLGADASIAVGPVGAGLQAATTDILQYTRNKGLYAGLTFEGAVITPRDAFNHTYYGQAVRPLDILVSRKVNNPQANNLRAKLASFNLQPSGMRNAP